MALRKHIGLTTPIEAVLNILLTRGVQIPSTKSISQYLRRYPDMTDILVQICGSIKERFDSDTQLSLEVYEDREIDDRYLTLYVRQVAYEKDLLDKIDRITQDYSETLSGKSGWLLITTDFRPTR